MASAQLLASAFVIPNSTLVLKPANRCTILRRQPNQYRSLSIRAAGKTKAPTPPPVGKGKKPPQTNSNVLMATDTTRVTVMSTSSSAGSLENNKTANKGQANTDV